MTRGKHEPLDESSRRNRKALLDQPCCWKSRGKRGQADDPESPFGTKRNNQAIHGKRDNCSTESTSSIHNAVCHASLLVEVLGWNC